MPFLQNLRRSLGGYWTPEKQKTRHLTRSPSPQRRTTRSPSLADGEARLDREGTPSPTKRTSEWITELRDISRTPGALGVKGGRIVKGPMTNRQATKGKVKFWDRVLPRFLSQQPAEIRDDIEGSTLVDRDRASVSPDFDDEDTQIDVHGTSQAESHSNVGARETPDVEEGEAGPSLITPGDDDRYYQPTKEDLKIMKSWTHGQVWLFHELNNRCFKPLIRETWRNYDFVTFPDDVVSNDDEKVPIKPLFGSEYNGKSLHSGLMYLIRQLTFSST